METNRAVSTSTRSKTLFLLGLAASLLFLGVSQYFQSVLVPASGVIPSPSLIATGSVLTFLGFLSTLVMAYSMVLRRKGL
jgi:hypothetical protein